ncbi:MAG: thioredoxin domain-containing protein, partial [Candidatus Hydrogenedentota bacterium]
MKAERIMMSTRKSANKPLPPPEEIAKLPPDGGPEFNRLVHEKSPYLLQHARNPVDWYPWGAEAFAKAEREKRPIFLSIGYSTCHWCHVMERESFENEEVAELLNRHYVSIKVDREERPDVDEIYMNATQLVTGRGGWPNSVWLLPDGRPWYAGTYFPPEDSLGRPGFKTVLVRLAEFSRTRRQEVEAQANQLSDVMKRISSGRHVEGTGKPTRDIVKQALDELRNSFDKRLGGFGDAPKFPPHGSLNLIFYEYRRTRDASLLKMATHTLDAMGQGGIHDHVGGGFHRYSTDDRWLLPHFEKMLYDNAQLSRSYVDAYLITKNEDYRNLATDTFEWVLREMTDKDGGFYSALDADSEGEEGKFYLWSRDEIIAILGGKAGELFCRVYNIDEGGNFLDEATGEMTGINIPHLKISLAEIAKNENISSEALSSRLRKDRRKLLERRSGRIWPHLDDKVLTSWNGLMISGFAYGGRHLGEPRYTAAAERAAEFLLSAMRKDGRLLRTYRDGQAKLDAYLDDYAFLADGLLELYGATGNERWLKEARALTEVLLRHYRDGADGGFYFTSEDHERLLTRSKDPYDKAIPSGNGMAAKVLVRLGRLTGQERYLETARGCFEAFLGLMQRAPRGAESLILALAMYLDEPPSSSVAAAPDTETSQVADKKPDAFARKEPVTAEAFASRLNVAPGEAFEVAVRLTIDKGWHINSNEPVQDYLIPTSIG